VRIHQVVAGLGDDLPPHWQDYRQTIAAGLTAYRDRDFTRAACLFTTARDLMPNEKLPRVYLQRLEELGRSRLATDWDCVTTMTHK